MLCSINQTNQIYLFDPNCTSRAQGAQTTTIGNGRICITNAVAGARYILQVKYDSKSVIGSAYTGAPPIVQYTFESRINGVSQPGSIARINMVQGCTSVYVRTAAPKTVAPTVSAFPNPYIDQLTFTIKSGSSAGLAKLKIYDMIGRNVADVFEGMLDAGIEKKVKYNLPHIRQPLIYVLTIDGKKVHGRLIPGIPE